MLIKPLQVAPGPPAVLRRCRPLATRTHGIHLSCGPRWQRFEAEVTFPVRAKVIDIPKALAAVETEVMQMDSVGRGATAAILLAMNVKAMQMLIAPGKQDLQDRMEVCQRGLAGHQYPTPDEGADTPQDNAQLVDTQWCRSRSHALRVA